MAVTTEPRPSYSLQKDVLMAVYRATGEDRLSLLAAGVAFYVLFAIFPALGAATWIYGLLANPSPIRQQLDTVREVVPAEAYGLIEGQLVALAAKTSTGITLTGIFSLLVFLYSARLAAYSMIEALNVVYKVKETRGFIEAEATALLFTILAIIVFVLAIGLLVVMPALFHFLHFPPSIENSIHYLRWPGLAALVVAAFALFYRYGPNRVKEQWRWITWGAIAATAIWLIASFGFSWYVSSFGTYDRIYGSLGAVVILLFWFWLTAFSALLGAELDKAIEDRAGSPHRLSESLH